MFLYIEKFIIFFSKFNQNKLCKQYMNNYFIMLNESFIKSIISVSTTKSFFFDY